MATTYLSPIGNDQQSDANGDPLNAGTITTYAAGTTTPIATYTDNTGGTAQANPIVLNSSGLPASPIWLPAGEAVKMVIKDSDGNTIQTVDNVSGINDPSAITAQSEWVVWAAAPTYVNTTSFRLTGDQTLVFMRGRRVRTVNTGGTIDGYVFSVSYSSGTGLTTVTFAADGAASLDSGLSQVSYGMLSTTSPSYTTIRSGTATAATSGTSIDFTSIPAWVKRITVMFTGVSTSGTSPIMIQLGDAGGPEVAGYTSGITCTTNAAATTGQNSTAGILVTDAVVAGSVLHATCTLTLLSGPAISPINTWVGVSCGGFSNAAAAVSGGGSKATSAVLDRIRITTAGGADTFDAGHVNVLYE